MAKRFNKNFKFAGYVRVTETEKGKTGIGQELELIGVFKLEDMSEEVYKKYTEAGYKWLMPLFFDKNGNRCNPWEAETKRAGFFYKSFQTKKDRTASTKRAKKYLVNPTTETKKPEPKKTETKKTSPKKTAEKPAVDFSALSGKQLNELFSVYLKSLTKKQVEELFLSCLTK